jgi:hypothetical protein
LPGSRRQELDNTGRATVEVEDYADDTTVILDIEFAQGSILWESDALTPSNDTRSELAHDIPDLVFQAATGRTLPSEGAVLVRAGRFVKLDDAMLDVSGYRLFIAPVRPHTLPDGSDNPQTAVVRNLLGLDGAGEITTFETVQLDPRRIDDGSINALGLQAATVHPDGAFDVSIDIIGDELAWLWLLLGPSSYAGYQLDPLTIQPRTNVVIILPLAATVPDPATGTFPSTPGDGTPGNGNHDCRPPLEFDERQLVDHPDTFNDDPGGICTPFENPNRILGERRFFTVLRIDQPEIGGQSSLKVSRPITLDVVPPIRLTTVSASLASRETGGSTGAMPIFTNTSAMRNSLVTTIQPRFDLRNSLNRNIFRPSLGFWKKWVREKSKGRAPVNDDNPIEWEGDPSIYQAASVAGGHVLEWRVRWRSNGYSLGDVAHTLTLAPRQTKRISKISWRRRETAARRELTEVSDALTQVTTRARDYTDAVQSSLSEWARGQSKSRTTGVAGGIGFAMGPVVIGGGAAHGRASSSSSQSGGRRVAASEHQQLRDAIRQYGEATRRLESTVVTEVTQEEEVEGVSETLRNINYCHSMTVVYYEILRHLRVDTEFSGLRECLFVPFSITPFDVDKALKWREQLMQGMLDRRLRWALDYLDEVDSAWANSSIPAGPRMDQEIKFLTGSIYIQLSIERPREIAAEEALETYYEIWAPLAPILGMPVRRIVERLTRVERDRDRFYQREVAPTMASRWADRLELEVNGSVLSGVDFTLATRYRFGRTVRVDFTAPVSGLTRRQLVDFTVRATQPLAVGSVANVKSLNIHYHTDHYNRRVGSVPTTDDLIDPANGQPDPGANLYVALTSWEERDQRRYIEDAVERLITHLNANAVYYHKVIWWLMDRDELYMLLDGFTAPYGRRFENGVWVDDTGRSIASVVERDPMAILGNTLVMRVAAGAFMGIDGHASPAAAHHYYYDSQVRSEPLRVSMPTEGLYAQALMDKCEACEEYHGSTDWVLTNEEPELEALADQLGTRRQAPADLTPTRMPESIISLQNAPAAPDPTGLAGILQAVTTSNAFRDMAGLAGTQANAMGALTQAASLAQGFGQMAVDFQKSKQGTADAKQKLSNIKKAQSEGLIDDSEAKRQSARVLDDQNMSSKAPQLTQDESIKTALNNAAATGQPIEASRQTKDGFETVKVGESSEDAARPARNYIIERDDLTPEARAFNPQSHDISGFTSFSVRIRETDDLPDDAFVRWSVPPSANGAYTLAGGANVQSGETVQITALRPGKSEIDVELRRTDGTVLESVKYPLSIPQFVSVDIDAGTFTPALTGFGLIAPEIEAMLEESKRVCLAILNTANVRTVWLMEPFRETLPAQFAGGGTAANNLTTATIRGDNPTRYGQTTYGAGVAGPASFNDTIDVFPGAFATPVSSPNANEHVDEVTNSVATVIKNSALTSTPEKHLAIRVLGRLIGETLAHEILHSLIGFNISGRDHNPSPGIENDIMNFGFNRSFTARTGFEIDPTQIAGGDLTSIITNDNDVFFINIPTGIAQAQLNTHFPVPGRGFS